LKGARGLKFDALYNIIMTMRRKCEE